jgi:hypothetical protein
MRTVTRIQRKKTSVSSERRLDRRPISRVAISSSVMWTPQVLVGAVLKLPSSQIAWLVQASIDELDRRSGDSDFEDDPDDESN